MIKCLVVEHNAEFRGFLKALLIERFPDGSVDEANDAAEALAFLRDSKPSILVLDIALPGSMNGLALVARIREDGPDPPILIISNYVLPEYQLEAARAGADWFLPKAGCTTVEIISAVERLIAMVASRGTES